MANVEELWFNTPDAHTLCRMGGNGAGHPSQLYAVKKYVKEGMSFLDYGAGSGTTYEALQKAGIKLDYLGVDVIPKFTKWCQENFDGRFEVNPSLHKIDQPDKSFDVVYSRHVVDHMESFEKAMDEHIRVARKLVIVVLWRPLKDSEEHDIKHIIDQRGLPTEKIYENEYTNDYSRPKVMTYLNSLKDWKLIELKEGIQGEGTSANNDVCIVLRYEKDINN